MSRARKPLAIDLCSGLGGWTYGLLAEGYDVIGFDIERHAYGEHRYPAQLVLQDIRTIHGAQFRDASLIVASPPCQEFSYMAMPWTRAKQIARAFRARARGDDSATFPDGYTGSRTVTELTALFDACFRIQREAIAAAGRFIPLVVENVRGAQPWVGRSRWAYGSFHLFGDVPALMPITLKAVKVGSHPGLEWSKYGQPGYVGRGFTEVAQERATKNDGGSWFNVAHNTTSGRGQNPVNKTPTLCPICCSAAIAKGLAPAGAICDGCAFGMDGVKQGGDWFNAESLDGDGNQSISRRSSSKSSARKAASARIAMIPLPLARWIAKAYYPKGEDRP